MCSTLIDGLDYGHEIKLGQERRHLEEVSREAEVQLPHVGPSVCRVSSALGAPGEAHLSMTADVVSRAGLASLFPCLTELRALSLLPSLAPEPLGFYTTVTGTHVPAQIPGPRLPLLPGGRIGCVQKPCYFRTWLLMTCSLVILNIASAPWESLYSHLPWYQPRWLPHLHRTSYNSEDHSHSRPKLTRLQVLASHPGSQHPQTPKEPAHLTRLLPLG